MDDLAGVGIDTPVNGHAGVVIVSGDHNRNNHAQADHTCGVVDKERNHDGVGRVARTDAFLDALEGAFHHAYAFRASGACERTDRQPVAVSSTHRPLRLPLLFPLGSYRYAYQPLVRSTVSPRQKVADNTRENLPSAYIMQKWRKMHSHCLFTHLPS